MLSLQGVGGGTHAVKVTSVLAATLKPSDGPSSSCVLVADESQLYVVQHGTIVLALPTPDTITAVRDINSLSSFYLLWLDIVLKGICNLSPCIPLVGNLDVPLRMM